MQDKSNFEKQFNNAMYNALNAVASRNYKEADKSLKIAYKYLKAIVITNKKRKKYISADQIEVEKENINKKLSQAQSVIQEQRNMIDQLQQQINKKYN